MTEASNASLSDDDLRRLWRNAGGSFHGPKVETGTMPEAKLLPFLRNGIEGGKRSDDGASPPMRQVRHVKRGTSYEVLGQGEVQLSKPNWPWAAYNPTARLLREGDRLVVYRSHSDKALWLRFPDEFEDGRFEDLPPSTEARPLDAFMQENTPPDPSAEVRALLPSTEAQAGYAKDSDLAAYRAAVDRVNCATDAEIGGIHRTFAPASTPAEALPSQTSGAEAIAFITKLIHMQSGQGWTRAVVRDAAANFLKSHGIAITGHTDTTAEIAALAKPASEPAGGGVREAIETALRRIGGLAVIARKPNALRFIAEVAEREVAALPSPASSPAEAEALPAGVVWKTLAIGMGAHLELLEAHCSVQTGRTGPAHAAEGHELREAGRKFIAMVKDALSSAPAPAWVEWLGKPEEWADARAELAGWTASAFLANEKVKDEPRHKRDLYSFLCGLSGFLLVGEDAARALLAAPLNAGETRS